ncbi:phosphotriesterase-related protein [Pseudonocardia ailaonensis]|uniref:Phosphotriesterase-related protein n=1 Tax=Pseudonocardia ailaonensis TaxID=367279 RepID=A0ABN2N7V1_9PSEU
MSGAGEVATVRGPVAEESLGRVLMHEHVFVLSPEAVQDYPADIHWDEEEKIALAVTKLTELVSAGIGTIVDLTVLNMGRFLPRLARINAAVDLHIVVATGLYTFDVVPRFLKHIGPGRAIERSEPLVEMFVRDIEAGIGDTGIKAGILKCATDVEGLTPDVDRVLRAVARAHRETGAPISTHTHAASEQGLAQQEVFLAEGVDLTRTVIGHSGDSTDLDYLRRLADRGSYLGMDRFGLDRPPHSDFDTRVGVVADMCAAGYADRMVLSHDASCWTDWLPEELLDGSPFTMPNWRFTHVSEDVVPALRARGVTPEQIDLMLIDNPRRILGGQKEGY